MEFKDIKELLDGLKSDLEKSLDEKIKAGLADQIKSLEEKITELEGKGNDSELAEIKSAAELLKTQVEKLDVKLQKVTIAAPEAGTKSFNECLKETIEANADAIKGHKPNSGIVNLDLKAVGDMGIAANFPAATALYQDTRTGLLINPYERTFLGDILPSGTSTGTQIVYPQENGGEGGIGEWTSGDKPQVDYDFTTQTVSFAWLAGVCIVERAMLDDIPWLISYLQNRLLLDLKAKENDYILNKAVIGLLAKATAYNGAFTSAVDRIIDASWGQIVEDTKDMYSPTHVIMKPREAVKIGLNKADGSGEYDLPQGSVAFSNGKLQVGGLDVIGTTSMAANNFLAMDVRATQFVKRLAPELRMFEDAALAKQNKVMFRIEERVALATYNTNALVKGLLIPA
ncbi:MAG: phage major capsid protein [Sphingobacteriaceae bacterium]|nr:phage major capsid protein [Sphingobacteriaceae bacterium]